MPKCPQVSQVYALAPVPAGACGLTQPCACRALEDADAADAAHQASVSNSQLKASLTQAKAPCPQAKPAKQAPNPDMAPEEVVARSCLDAATVAGFLFENYPAFVDETAIEDAATAAAGFSDAMHMVRRSADAWGVHLACHSGASSAVQHGRPCSILAPPCALQQRVSLG